MGRRKHVKTLKPTYSGAVAAYEYAGMMRDVPGLGSMWSDSMVGTRPNGIAAGATMNNWTGMAITMVAPSALPPQFNGVADVVGTGQAFNPATNTMLNTSYQEYGSFPVPMQIQSGTIECWSKAVDTANEQSLLAYHYNFGMGTHGGNFKYKYYDSSAGGENWVDSGIAVDTNWHHMLLTFATGSTANLWIDGVKRVSAGAFAPAGVLAGRTWYIGDHNYGNEPYEGLIDTARFYDRHLTDDEIIRNYWSGIGLHS